MRKFMISSILLSAVLAAAPAAAQYGQSDRGGYDDGYRGGYGDNYRGNNRFDRQIDQLIDRIHRAEDRDVISRREEDRLLRQARQLNYLERRYSRNGFSRAEAQDLQRRIQNLRAQFRWERFDDRGRYGYNR